MSCAFASDVVLNSPLNPIQVQALVPSDSSDTFSKLFENVSTLLTTELSIAKMSIKRVQGRRHELNAGGAHSGEGWQMQLSAAAANKNTCSMSKWE